MSELCLGRPGREDKVLTVPKDTPKVDVLKNPLDSNFSGASPWPEVPWDVLEFVVVATED